MCSFIKKIPLDAPKKYIIRSWKMNLSLKPQTLQLSDLISVDL